MNVWVPALLRQMGAMAAASQVADRINRFLSLMAWLGVLVLPWLTTSCVSTMTNYRGHKVFNPQ